MLRRISHPPERGRDAVGLVDHLEDVADRAMEVIPSERTTPFGASTSELVARLARVHDFGKSTTWFQEYVRGESHVGGPTHHSPIGALLAYQVLDATSHPRQERLAGYVAVAVHHGTLPDVAEYVFERTAGLDPGKRRRKEDVVEQVENIDESAPSLAEDRVDKASDGHLEWVQFAASVRDGSAFQRVRDDVSSMSGIRPEPEKISRDFYACVLQCWSALVLADKTSAANAPVDSRDGQQPDRDTLARYIDDLGDSKDSVSPDEASLNEKRRTARDQVLANARAMAQTDSRLATITLPTGMGKTLSGLDAALTLRDHTDRRRVIYALPFTSIIDQVVDEVEGIFGFDGRGEVLTVHHHLAETVIEPDGGPDAGEPTDGYAHIAEMLGESWRSGMIVTTFVQLLESLVGPANTQSMKLPALYDSVVILDEIQSIPHDWWPLVDRLVELLNSEYNAFVIAMTATQPRLFDRDVQELVDDPTAFYRASDRVEYVLDGSVKAFPDAANGPLGYDEAADALLGSTSSGDAVLSICNTIDSATALTEALTARQEFVDVGHVLEDLLEETPAADLTREMVTETVLDSPAPTAFVHLSTRIRPCDRRLLIGVIKELTERDCPLQVVSTQLVEAGVDVSFDRVHRDLAPLDSIVQAAGRCNRSFERDRGTVVVWWLDAPGGQQSTPSEAVYNDWGESLLSVTDQVVDSISEAGATTLPESLVAREGVDEYYRRLTDDRGVGKQEYVEWLEHAEGERLHDLSLIDQRLAFDVVVCRTEADSEMVHAVSDAWGRHAYGEAKSLLQELRSAQVSIPVYRDDSPETLALRELEQLHPETETRWVDTRDPRFGKYFDSTTGFVVPDSTVEARFL